MNQKKSFALGYSYIVESFVGWLMYGTLVSGGMSTIIAYFSQKTNIATTSLLSCNTIAGFVGVAGSFICMEVVKRTSKRFVLTTGR